MPDYVGHVGDRHFTRAEDRAAVEGWKTFSLGESVTTGEGNGLPATDLPFRVTAMTMFRLVDGKIVEEWNVFDDYSFLQQLRLLPKAGD